MEMLTEKSGSVVHLRSGKMHHFDRLWYDYKDADKGETVGRVVNKILHNSEEMLCLMLLICITLSNVNGKF